MSTFLHIRMRFVKDFGAEMTGRSQSLLELYPEAVAEISPRDAANSRSVISHGRKAHGEHG
jgi:hypothetical protein